MRCNGPCDQGRRPCPTPEACETAAEISLQEEWRAAARSVVFAFLVIVFVAAVF